MIDKLHPSQRFLYEYGCFMTFWSNFELTMEVAIHKYLENDPKENCRRINKLTAGIKKNRLKEILDGKSEIEKLEALNNVFEVAERNDWIHGHILNPNGDFSTFTRLRVKFTSAEIQVTNNKINFVDSPFDEFYTAYENFMQKIELTKEQCDVYITDIQN